MTKLKLTKLVLETKGGKSVELSMDEAKELHDQLHELFGTKYVPSQPIFIDRWPYRPYWDTQIYCDSTVVPQNGGLDVQCKIEGASGLSATYSSEIVQ